jgi:hypothetical protein
LENLVANYTDPTSRPEDPFEQRDPGLGEPLPTGTSADSEVEYARSEGSGRLYGEQATSEFEAGSTVETAKSAAASVKDTTADAAAEVRNVAMSEVSNVASEAKYQTRNLVDQTRTQLRSQAINQQSQLAAKLHGWSSEFGSMASKSDDSGPMTELVQEASRRMGEISHWLDNHEPRDLLDEVKRFARRRPGTFLALAAAAGIVAGRLTRGAVATNTSVDSHDTEVTPARAYDIGRDDRGGPQGGDAYGTRTYQSSGYNPPLAEVAGETSYQGGGMPAPGRYSTADTEVQQQYPSTGPVYPDVAPTTEEPYYPPPAEGEVRR